MTTTIKHRNFCKEDMKDKSVYELPGIGNALGTKLTEAGFPLARDIYSKLKTYFDFNKANFQEWMKTICNANAKQSSDCYNCLKEWHEQFAQAQKKEKTKKVNTSPSNCDKKKKDGGRRSQATLDEESGSDYD